jgi:hypothetical protein
LNEEAIAEWSRIGEELRRLHPLTVADTKPPAGPLPNERSRSWPSATP